MTKKPRGKPVLMEEGRPMRRPGQRPYTRVIQDEFRNCDTPYCPNIVSVQDKPEYYGLIFCALHRDGSLHD